MSYPDPPQQPQWQQPQQPGQGFTPPQGPGQPYFAPPQQPGGQYTGGQYTGGQYPGQQYPGGQPPQGPGAPMGPGGPGQPPYGGQYSGGQVPPSGGGRKWLIPAAAGVALVVMGGTIWAAASLVNFSGPQPESVLPGNSVAFAKVDLDIDGSQIIDLLRFAGKLPDELTEDTAELDEDTSGAFAEMFSDAFDVNLRRTEEWIGNKVGLAVWPTGDSEAAVAGDTAMALALSVEDAAAAEEQFVELRDSDDVYFEMVDDFVVFTEGEAGINDYNDQMSEHGDLESDDTYSGDLGNVPRGSIALAWTDLGELGQMSGISDELSRELGTSGDSLDGRMTASVRVDGDYLEARMDIFGFEVENEDVSWLAGSAGSGLDAMGGLPADTVMAFGGSGLDESLRTAWEDDELPFLNAGDRTEMEDFFNSVGAPLPDGFTSLLGTSTAFGLTDFDPDSFNWEPSFEYRAVDGDERALEGFLDEAFGSPYSALPMPSVSSDGDTVVVSNGRGGSGRLGEDDVFQQTMQNLDDAVLAGYFDLRQVLSRDQVDSPDQWGAVGLGMSVLDEGQRAVIELRWSPSGG
ncbi:hypothetical protein [Nocardiopsis valliformis]|uniref:hypothetical protein n=1 Tax=Nocardiopsis valliformis TaxID=239974 RepID=UPI0003478FD6|nr:hypothetical protein [Nocardiopsis valliformis]